MNLSSVRGDTSPSSSTDWLMTEHTLLGLTQERQRQRRQLGLPLKALRTVKIPSRFTGLQFTSIDLESLAVPVIELRPKEAPILGMQ